MPVVFYTRKRPININAIETPAEEKQKLDILDDNDRVDNNQIDDLNNEGETDKQYIIRLFKSNVKGKNINIPDGATHDGAVGHWLEKQMGIMPNSKNEPDIRGYEMKKQSKKITFGDYSASEYVFSKNREIINKYNNWSNDTVINRKEFISYFGEPNPKKHNRSSWSGKTCPTYFDKYTNTGQIIEVNEDNDIIIKYTYSKDERVRKEKFPEYIKHDNLVIAVWKFEKMQRHINNKFNHNGFFICEKIGTTFGKIRFGPAFDFEHFIQEFKNKKIIFDSGMYSSNSRNYSHFRATNFWESIITEEY